MNGTARIGAGGGREAWSPDRDIPWERAETIPEIRRSARIPVFDFLTRSALWRGLSERRRESFRIEALDWTVCQLIHAESLALKTAREIASSPAPAEVRAAASAMAVEELRHRRAFVLYRERVLARRGPLYAHWYPALEPFISRQTRWDGKVLALQVAAERAFAGSLLRLRKACRGPVLRRLLDLVIGDEAGHCREGLLLERDRGGAERARFIFDACRAMVGEFPADLFARAGLDSDACFRTYRARTRVGREHSFLNLLADVNPLDGASRSLRRAYAAFELV